MLAACGGGGSDPLDDAWADCQEAALERAGNPEDATFIDFDRSKAMELRDGGWAIPGGLNSATFNDAFLCTAAEGEPVRVVFVDE